MSFFTTIQSADNYVQKVLCDLSRNSIHNFQNSIMSLMYGDPN